MLRFLLSKHLVLLCSACILFVYCSKTSKPLDEELAELPTVPIDVNLNDTAKMVTSKVFNSITYIPLETNSESIFGRLDRMEVTDRYLIIYDSVTNSIYFFEKSGKFSHKISNKNKAVKDSYKKIGDFAIDKKKGQLILQDSYQGKLVVYSLDGKRLYTENYPIFFSTFFFNDGYSYYYRAYENEKDSKFNEIGYKNLVVSKEGEIINRYLQYDSESYPRTDFFDAYQNFFLSNDSVFFSLPGSYNIYQLGKENITKIFKLNIQEELKLPSDFLSNIKFVKNRVKYIEEARHQNIIWNWTDFYVAKPNVVSFNLQCMADLNENFLYDIKNRRTINMKNILCDELTYSLPFIEKGIHASSDGNLYSSVSAKFMFYAALKVGKSRLLKANKILNNFYEKSTVMSNPVVTVMDLKSSLK